MNGVMSKYYKTNMSKDQKSTSIESERHLAKTRGCTVYMHQSEDFWYFFKLKKTDPSTCDTYLEKNC